MSPILFVGGAVILAGGIWYVVSKWPASPTTNTGTLKCPTTAEIDKTIADVKANLVSAAVAAEVATKLEAGGCKAEATRLRDGIRMPVALDPKAAVDPAATTDLVSDLVSDPIKPTLKDLKPDVMTVGLRRAPPFMRGRGVA